MLSLKNTRQVLYWAIFLGLLVRISSATFGFGFHSGYVLAIKNGSRRIHNEAPEDSHQIIPTLCVRDLLLTSIRQILNIFEEDTTNI